MAYPWNTNDILTASDLNALVTTIVPTGVGAWTSWTPTVTQSGSVTVTVNQAFYFKVGRMVTVQFALTVTGSGTGSNVIVIGGLPFNIATPNQRIQLGVMDLFDTSTSDNITGTLKAASASTLATFSTRANGQLGVTTFTAALAAGDELGGTATYRATS